MSTILGLLGMLLACSLYILCMGAEHSCSSKDAVKKPFVDGAKTFIGGVVSPYHGTAADVFSPIIDSDSNGEKFVIGKLAQMNEEESLSALEHAKTAWGHGHGVWPQMSTEERIKSVENVVTMLREKRSEIVSILQWEIAKSVKDAASEFDRTMLFIEKLIEELREETKKSSVWQTIGGILFRMKRAAIGIMLCLGPFNYPFNETYATMIPALLMGNVVILKLPTIGGLAHVLTMEIFAAALPPGVVNFVSGSGRTTIPPLMKTGRIDILAFIGGSSAADRIIKDHPNPHRLKLFLQLEGKNLGIVTPNADLSVAAAEVLTGSTSYNGQRCTAIKLVVLHESVVDGFFEQFLPRIASLKGGLPWDDGVSITPLPEPNKTQHMKALIADAISKGAKVLNEDTGGGYVKGNLMHPAVVFPVTPDMLLWEEEQFGPVIPVATYRSIEDLMQYYDRSKYGQQCAIFTRDGASVSTLVDFLSTAVGRININTQCGRSPDSVPFSGRRSSALGTMSISESLKQFSVEIVVAGSDNNANGVIMKNLSQKSSFLA